MVSGSGDRRTTHEATVRVWDLATARELRRFADHRGAVNAVAFTPDGRSVVSGSEDAKRRRGQTYNYKLPISSFLPQRRFSRMTENRLNR